MLHILSKWKETWKMGNVAARAASVYCCLLLGVQPLLLHNGFYDVVETKQAAFLLLSGLFLTTLPVLALLRAKCYGAAAPGTPLCAEDVCMLLFVGASALGAALSDAPWAVAWGAANRYQGLVTTLTYGALWFALTRLLRFGKRELAALSAGGAFVCLVGILNHFGLDPLLTRAGLSPAQRGGYLSTIGNVDFYGAYLCLLLPGLPVVLCRAKEKRMAILCAALLLLAECGSLSGGSDGAAIALFAASLLTPLLLTDDIRALRRLPLVWLCMLLVAAVYARLGGNARSGLYLSHTARLFARPAVTIALAVCLSLLGALLARMDARGANRFGRAYGLTLCGLALLLLFALLIYNACFRDVDLGALTRFVRWGAHWGTDRGMIWRMCAEAYAEFPWWRKLVGGGPGCVLAADMRVRVFGGSYVDAAHNEYLQYLLTSGLMGLAAYVGLLAATARRIWRARRDAVSGALLMGLAAYAAQAAVGIAQPATTPLFFVLLAAADGRARGSEAPSVTHDLDGQTHFIYNCNEADIPGFPTRAQRR